MRRIDTATKAVDLFGAGKHGFKDGDPALAILATKLNAAFFNSAQEELASVVEAVGLGLNPADNTQLLQAIRLLPGRILGKSIAGGANVTLTADESQYPMIVLTGVITANISVIVPNAGREWVIANGTTGAFTVTVKTAAGSGVAVAQGASLHLYCDLANVNQVGASSTPQAVVGQFSNLKASATGLSAVTTITADELVVENAANQYQTLRAVSVTPSFAAAGANGLDVGAANSQTANTWYYLWVIWNGTTTAGLLSLSAAAPTMPSGYTHKARVGAVRTDSTANKYPLSFTQAGRRSQYKVVAGSNVAGMPIMASGVQGVTVTPTFVAIPVASFIPPTAVAIDLVVRCGNPASAICAPNNQYGGHNSITNPPPLVFTVSATTYGAMQAKTMLLESANIFYAADGSGAVGANLLACAGWEDNL